MLAWLYRNKQSSVYVNLLELQWFVFYLLSYENGACLTIEWLDLLHQMKHLGVHILTSFLSEEKKRYRWPFPTVSLPQLLELSCLIKWQFSKVFFLPETEELRRRNEVRAMENSLLHTFLLVFLSGVFLFGSGEKNSSSEGKKACLKFRKRDSK